MTIRERNGSLEVVVYLGPDPMTGKDRRKSRSVRGTNRAAWRRARELELALRQDAMTEPAADLTVGELFVRWLAVARKEQSGQSKAERDFKLYLEPRVGKTKVSKLTVAQLDRLYVDLEATGSKSGGPLSASTVHGAHRTLRAVLSQAVVWGLIPTNPAARATPPRVASPDPVPPNLTDVRKLYTEALTVDPDLAVFLRLAASTGGRRGQICGFRWTDIDIDQATIRKVRAVKQVVGDVYVAETKTRTRTVIALGPATIRLLAQHRGRMALRAVGLDTSIDRDGYMFSSVADCTTPWSPHAVTMRFARLRKTCGLEHIRLKEMRHFAATAMFAEGVAATIVSGRLDHSRTSTTHDIYSAWSPVADRQAAGIMDDLLDE